MICMKQMKILNNFKDLKKIRIKYKNKIVGLCHGAFDIFHIGHLEHLKEAKKYCDILIVGITAAKFISKSPSLPYNDDQARVEMVKNLEIVDYVYLENSASALSVINSLGPNIYFKGKDYSKKNNDYVGNLKKELLLLKKKRIKFHLTKTDLQSSSKIYLNNYSNLDKRQTKYIKDIKEKFLLVDALEEINKLKNQTVNVFGETIIDRFKFIKILGLASKFPIYSGVTKSEQSFPGGAMAVAYSAIEFVKKVNLITGIDNTKLPKKFFKKKGINLKNITNISHQTKTRYVNEYRLERFFQIANTTKINLDHNANLLVNEIKKFKKSTTNLVMDYGVWKNNKKILDFINKKNRNYYLNVQTNSHNFGKNLINRYKNFGFCSLDYKEFCVNLGLPNEEFQYLNFNSFKKLKNEFYKKFKKNKAIIVITLGKNGSVVFNKDFLFHCPVFISSAVDTTGCGDMFFLIFSLLIKNKTSIQLSQFIATAYAGLHSLFIGNKKVVEKIELIKYLNFLYKL